MKKAKVAAPKADTALTSAMTAEQLAGNLIGLLKRVQDGSFGQPKFHALNEGRSPFDPPRSFEVDVDDRVLWWKAHFQGLYKINPDFSDLKIPKPVPGFSRLIIIPKGLTHRKWVESARMIHGVDLYTEDLDASVTENVRTSKDRSYSIWIRDRQEADEELKDKSANVLEAEKVPGITLLERLVGGTGYLFENHAHMDRDNVTLSSGSRYSGGSVPSVSWSTGRREVYVDDDSPDDSYSYLRARAVVSNP